MEAEQIQIGGTDPGPADLGPAEIASRLRLSVTRLARLLRQQDGSDLTITQKAALATIERHGPVTVGELAVREQIAAPTATNVVAKLEARQLVRRRGDKADRRVCRVEVTPRGQRELDRGRTLRTEWLTTRLDALGPEQRARLGAALDALDELTAAPLAAVSPQTTPPTGGQT